ncbi:hypothetical protein [Aquibium microcysteis]|uniref:hypothetical protein n=1 Tax=Aquibium microcysteis TaxID=675281 RepID=UPI00165CF97C|nr:hypothetical protein [Aquibium microcysteis]
MNGTDATRAGARGGGGWGWTPQIAWVALTMLLSLRGLYSMLPIASDASLPPAVTAYLQAGIAVAVVNLLWGGWVMLAARSRSRALRRGFLGWQSFNLVAIAASVGFATLYGNFVTTAAGLILPGVEFVVGIALIVHALRLPDTTAPDDAAPSPPAATRPASTAGTVLGALLGGVAGAVLGGIVGFPFGAFLAERLGISCFEGGCGYFAAAVGLLLVLAGFVAGIVAAMKRIRRAGTGSAT